ncbi:MAG TPA: S8 family serine peptidase [Candidatus Obscuribacterales bacterium]
MQNFPYHPSQPQRYSRFSILCALICMLVLTSMIAAKASAEDGQKLKTPKDKQNARASGKLPPFREDVLLVMPAANADKDEVTQTLKDVHGEIINTIGTGAMTCYVVKIEKGYFVEAEKKLSKDKHFRAVQRDYAVQQKQAVVNDPYFASEWHLPALNVINAWSVSQGSANIIGVLDSGVSIGIRELAGKCYAGFDGFTGANSQKDVNGHGTMVSTTAAAITNNGTGTAAPARNSLIYPVRAGTRDGSIYTSALINGINQCGNLGIKLINISANGEPPYTFSNKNIYSSLHQYFQWFHDTKGGLIFVSAGNTPVYDPNPMWPYFHVVSAINPSYTLASFSTYGSNIDFTGPGEQIYCTNKKGKVASVAGTSFSSPLVCSIAALVWGAKPSLTNVEVTDILRSTAYKDGTNWNQWYGYGLPNAHAALMRALYGL